MESITIATALLSTNFITITITHVVIHVVLHDEKNSDTTEITHMIKLVVESKNIFIEHIK